jgi:hypothetical protein
MEGLARPELERLYLFLERAFHRLVLCAEGATSITALKRMLPAKEAMLAIRRQTARSLLRH